jgi:hypothetical protein
VRPHPVHFLQLITVEMEDLLVPNLGDSWLQLMAASMDSSVERRVQPGL